MFLAAFVIRLETTVTGPASPDEVDDLQIQEAWLDPGANALVLITRDRWARVALTPIIETNRQLRTAAPRDGNFVHWKSFTEGRPPVDQVRQMEPVDIRTDRFASFAYYHYPPDGRPRHNSEEAATVPDGYRAALYRSSAEYAEGNTQWFKSYVLATAHEQPDGLFGVQFFYHPDHRRSVVFRPPYTFGLFGPSFLALCIALPLALANLRRLVTATLFIVAFLLHGTSFFIYLALVRYGEAWSGQGPNHDTPYAFLVCGTSVLAALVFVRIVRALTAGDSARPPGQLRI